MWVSGILTNYYHPENAYHCGKLKVSVSGYEVVHNVYVLLLLADE